MHSVFSKEKPITRQLFNQLYSVTTLFRWVLAYADVTEEIKLWQTQTKFSFACQLRMLGHSFQFVYVCWNIKRQTHTMVSTCLNISHIECSIIEYVSGVKWVFWSSHAFGISATYTILFSAHRCLKYVAAKLLEQRYSMLLSSLFRAHTMEITLNRPRATRLHQRLLQELHNNRDYRD